MNTGKDMPYNTNPALNREQKQRDLRLVVITPEDIKATKECMRDGIFKAGLPFAFGLNFLSSYLHKIGILKNPPSLAMKFLAFPFTAFCGYFLFYSPYCTKMLRERIEAQENSEFQHKHLLPKQDTPYGLGETSFDTVTERKSVESESYFSPLNLDYESFQAQEFAGSQGESTKIKETTYDELRQKNRDNYQRQLYKHYEPRNNAPDRSSNAFILDDSKNTEFKASGLKNKYGDYME